MEFNKNKIIEKMRRNELATCFKINITDNIPAEIAALCGMDCVWLDMEHVACDYGQLEKAILGAKMYGAEVIVRTPRGAYSNLTRPLEMDASGVMVPHVMNYEDAKQVVYYTKFYPIGRRPIDGGNADGRFCMMETDDYLKYSNDEKLTIIQIEDKEALEDLDSIAALDGIDMLFFGPADFSQSIGSPENIWNEQTLEARKKVVDAALAHGKFAGTVGNTENVKELFNMGFRFISLGADVVALETYIKTLLHDVKRLGL